MKDTTVPMWLAGLGYWGIGFPICLTLGFMTPLRGTGIWIGLALALASVAVAMLLRFYRLTRPDRLDRHLMPPVSGSMDRPPPA